MADRILKDTDFAGPTCYTQAGSTNIVNTADTVVGLDTLRVECNNASILAGVITVTMSGIYSVSYSIPVDDNGSAGTTRGRIYAWVEQNDVAVPQSYAQCYARELSGGEGLSTSFLVDIAGSAEIKLVVRSSSTVDVSSEPGQAQLSLHRVARVPIIP